MVSHVPRLLLLLLFFECCLSVPPHPCSYVTAFSLSFGSSFFFTSMGAQKSLRTCVKARAYRPNHFLMFPCLCTRSGIISSKLNWSTSENVVLFDWLILLLPQISCDDVFAVKKSAMSWFTLPVVWCKVWLYPWYVFLFPVFFFLRRPE